MSCRKRGYTSQAKARKGVRYMSGRRQKPGECKIYLCPHPEHDGIYHLTSQKR